MKLYRIFLPVFLALIVSNPIFSQKNSDIKWWEDVAAFDLKNHAAQGRWSGLERHRALRIDLEKTMSALAAAPAEVEIIKENRGLLISLPQPGGKSERFYVWRVPVLHPDLEKKHPSIRTFAGMGADNPWLRLRMDHTMSGFHAMITGGNAGTVYIDPLLRGNTRDHVCYWKKFLKAPEGAAVDCRITDAEMEAAQLSHEHGIQSRAGDCGQLRTYRLALAGTGEYSLYHGGAANNKAPVLAAMTTTVNRINGIYERDFSVRMNLVPNNESIIYIDPATDPYDNFNTQNMLAENQTTCDNVIGTANYDVGHVFGSSNGGGAGVAFLQCVCNASNKAGGVSCADVPEGDFFDVRLVGHEFGHQFGGTHMQYNACNRWDPTSMEPGSGSTILGYASICPPNVESTADDYYHTGSLVPMGQFIIGGGDACAAKSGTGNTAPTINNLSNRIIPKSTPFVLEASASDATGEGLTYCWEQIDPISGAQQPMPPQSTNISGPMFRTFPPVLQNKRYFPRFEDVLSGFNYDWEELSSVGRDLNFRVTVRDNWPAGGCTDEKAMIVTVNGSSGPFTVTKPNTNIIIQSGATDTVKWNVANTNNAPVSCANVDILISTDGGLNFSTLLANTPNDGSQIVTFPNATTEEARIMVRSVGNVFYDVSNVNFYLGNYSSQCNQLFNSSDVPKSLSFRGETTSTLDISVVADITDLNVKNLNISHAAIQELGAWLISPTGTERHLFDQICNGSANMNINFDDEASNNYNTIPCPPANAGNFKPLETLNTFDNEEINGTWTLRIKDYDGPEAGTLNSWGIEVCFIALPVDLQVFKAKLVGPKTARLDWKTATEKQNKGFHIERSTGNALQFETIGWVAGHGDSREPRSYYFLDEKLRSNTQHYYRLRQEDTDGAFQYSDVAVVSTGTAAGLLQISPNPASTSVQITLFDQNYDEPLQISLWNAAGQLVLTQNYSFGEPLDISALPSGVYQVRAQEATLQWMGRIVKK